MIYRVINGCGSVCKRYYIPGNYYDIDGSYIYIIVRD